MRASPLERTSPQASATSHLQAFTLVELLVVVGIMLIMMALLGPAMNAIKGAGDVTKAAYDISGLIEGARSYAMANNTYTWVGFYEENAGTLIATNVSPPYTGKGRVLIAVVASKDGTDLLTGKNDPSRTIPAADITQIGKTTKLENIHLVDIGAPKGGANVDANTLDGRSAFPYDNNDPRNGGNSHLARISSESSDKTKFSFVAQGYTYNKTIRFTPRGEAAVNSTYDLRPYVEIGLRPTHGATPDNATANVVAIQFTGIAGNVKIYRR